jgi:hypothetical protein
MNLINILNKIVEYPILTKLENTVLDKIEQKTITPEITTEGVIPEDTTEKVKIVI